MNKKERNTAYKVIDNYLLFIKFKLSTHFPFLFKLADLICLKSYVFFGFIFDFRNSFEMVKDGINSAFTTTGPQICFS